MIIWVDKKKNLINIAASSSSSSSVEIIDNCKSTSTTSALSANQGRVIMETIGSVGELVDLINRKVV